MKTFDLIVYEKIKIWERYDISVEAESLEEAIDKYKNGDCEFYDSDVAYDTREYLEPSNEDPVTTEIYEQGNDKPVYIEKVKD